MVTKLPMGNLLAKGWYTFEGIEPLKVCYSPSLHVITLYLVGAYFLSNSLTQPTENTCT